MSESFDLGDIDRLTVGTVGPPGKRVFYLQASAGSRVITLKLEKTQVAALVAYLATLLSDLPSPGALPTAMELVEPVEVEWVVGALGVSYDEDRDRILVQAEELVDDDLTEGGPGEGGFGEGVADGASARFLATREQVAALAARGATVVSAGRPPCQLCGQPLDPGGHVCVRLNGHRSQSR